MRRILVATLLAIAISSNTGCFLPIYDADPAVRRKAVDFRCGGFAFNAKRLASVLVH